MDLLSAYRDMLTIRLFEESLLRCAEQGLVPGTIHPYTGQEAIAVGVLGARHPDEWVVSFYRCHGHALAAGCSPESIIREVLGRRGGLCGGKSGSMHLADRAHRLLGSTSIVAAQLPIAAGAAMAARLDGAGRAALVFCGDGALGAGGAYETLTIAAAKRLPLLVVCEDNGWQDQTDSRWVRHLSPADLVGGLKVPHVEVDGNDVEAVRDAATVALDACRAGAGPQVIVAHTYLRDFHAQLGEHPPPSYRPEQERRRWAERDPLTVAAERIPADLTDLRAEVAAEIDAILLAALAAGQPDQATATTGVSVTADLVGAGR
ncbi:thiamine pyrophosphate-dependent dehydrogenase E1 component subunit alpha [Verrucosispora sp. WMMD573]|uniref:thiamine pyrophosphate-dependent dehydrogenase E1 component subunit alpha n=1 Tax=Verrucosispora sp. WMMD573 TaxID=3015149 RepID=UPI00248D28EC|nr:thiamine pyrophosphate-dependent dehydrogenase E1 component subunit alpha [Verrucosispora sp. WMMD573]WBB56664.1 thiamine pyrophosphate-dependent dehydrogenase E1 component subunit alpha [Verrucosispora sp. WMMD573]